ncbi:hypothetical protein O3299_03295 [Janthinobacterium sp. SUN176]|uniref:hypothetical protein n=1 Tax=Janthinobacterium sp. SUN176 TaxID=3014788 RepID=UPI002712E7F7|nr:hypothetical protein [Janthinobacterium sp. SUN176]MDO8070531.1 hypothetical protein [Janthinobacterium sp. SUN176]
MRSLPPPRESARMLAGAGIAVLLHVLLWQVLRSNKLPVPPLLPQRSMQMLFLAPVARPARPLPPAVSKSQARPRHAVAITPAPAAMPAPAADAAALPPPAALDLDALKRLAKEAARQEGPSLAGPALTTSNKTAQAIASAARPKCDNDYKPRLGNVEFAGLAKLPFLLKGATGDSGCKW